MQRWTGTLYGSPPRLWGIHQCHELRRACARFTPTAVGNTCQGAVASMSVGSPPRAVGNTASDSHRRHEVHPHVCGELLPCLNNNLDGRFTPTAVGNTMAL